MSSTAAARRRISAGGNRRQGVSTRSRRRANAAKIVKEDQEFVSGVFEKYDTSHDGFLEVAELGQLLMKINGESTPSQEEVDIIVNAVDQRGGSCDGKIDKEELQEVLLEWRNYKEHSGFIEEKFALYDTDHSGALDRQQLRKLLTDLNEGQEVVDADLDLVFSIADKGDIKDGCIDKTELVQAIAVWFSNCMHEADQMVREDGSFQPNVSQTNTISAEAPVVDEQGANGEAASKTACCIMA